MEHLLARMDVNSTEMKDMYANMKTMEEKADADRKADRENLKQMTNEMKEEIKGTIHSMWAWRKETMAWQEMTGACLECREPA